MNISSSRNYINSINTNNLTYAKITDQSGSKVRTMTRIAILNARSIKNNNQLIVNELNDNNVDLAVISETWLKILMKTKHGWTNLNSNNAITTN